MLSKLVDQKGCNWDELLGPVLLASEVICVSLQRVSRCKGPGLGSVLPWLGHGKTRKRRQVRSSIKPVEDDDNSSTIVNTEQAAGSGQEDCNPQTRAGGMFLGHFWEVLINQIFANFGKF